MKTLKGKFTQRKNGQPIEKGQLRLRLSQRATLIATGEGVEEDLIKIPLDDEGAIPAGAEIIANDELRPAGTYYRVDVVSNACGNCYDEILKIVGDSPIDLNALTPETTRPDRVYEPDPEPEPEIEPEPVPRVRAVRRAGSSVNHAGFFGVAVNLPANTSSIAVPSFEHGNPFGVCSFHLSSKAVVGCASIIVDSPDSDKGKEFVVALFDGDGKRVLTIPISVGHGGIATGTIHTPVNLNAGDYVMAWGTNRRCSSLLLRGIETNRDLLCLLAGVARSGGGGSSLPDELGEITRCKCVPPVVYFEA